MTNLAKRGALGLRFSRVGTCDSRDCSGLRARQRDLGIGRAPGGGAKPTDNPFEDKGRQRRRQRQRGRQPARRRQRLGRGVGQRRRERERARTRSRPSRPCTGWPAWRGTPPAVAEKVSSAATSSSAIASSFRGWAASTPPTRCRRPTATAARWRTTRRRTSASRCWSRARRCASAWRSRSRRLIKRPLHAEHRLAGDLLAALVADPRQAQVQRHDDHPRRSVRGRRRGAHLPTQSCWD